MNNKKRGPGRPPNRKIKYTSTNKNKKFNKEEEDEEFKNKKNQKKEKGKIKSPPQSDEEEEKEKELSIESEKNEKEKINTKTSKRQPCKSPPKNKIEQKKIIKIVENKLEENQQISNVSLNEIAFKFPALSARYSDITSNINNSIHNKELHEILLEVISILNLNDTLSSQQFQHIISLYTNFSSNFERTSQQFTKELSIFSKQLSINTKEIAILKKRARTTLTRDDEEDKTTEQKLKKKKDDSHDNDEYDNDGEDGTNNNQSEISSGEEVSKISIRKKNKSTQFLTKDVSKYLKLSYLEKILSVKGLRHRIEYNILTIPAKKPYVIDTFRKTEHGSWFFSVDAFAKLVEEIINDYDAEQNIEDETIEYTDDTLNDSTLSESIAPCKPSLTVHLTEVKKMAEEAEQLPLKEKRQLLKIIKRLEPLAQYNWDSKLNSPTCILK